MSGAAGDLTLAVPRSVSLRRMLALPGGILLLASCTTLAISLGPVGIALEDVAAVILAHVLGTDASVRPSTDAIVWDIRLPRVLLAGLVGAALAVSGAAYQGVFRNPLADPYLLGVGAGAGLAAALAFVLDAPLTSGGFSLLPLIAFGGALVTVLIVYSMARSGGQTPNTTLILAGVAVSSLAVSAISYLLLLDQSDTVTILTWLLGGFNDSRWRDLAIFLPYVIPAVMIIFVHGRVLNVLQLDEIEARQVGVNVERTKAIILLAASLAAATSVAVAGIVGFVGLITPHAVRLVIGPDYRRLLPACLMVGASFLVMADLAARTVLSPAELPVGIVTSFAGVPFFLYLLRRQHKVYF